MQMPTGNHCYWLALRCHADWGADLSGDGIDAQSKLQRRQMFVRLYLKPSCAYDAEEPCQAPCLTGSGYE